MVRLSRVLVVISTTKVLVEPMARAKRLESEELAKKQLAGMAKRERHLKKTNR